MPLIYPSLSSNSQGEYDPEYFMIVFSDYEFTERICIFLRYTWISVPPAALGDGSKDESKDGGKDGSIQNADSALCKWMAKRFELPCEEWDMPLNEDVDALRTSWRNAVYYLWCQIFVDISNFFRLENYSVWTGNVHPPNYEVFSVPFPTGDTCTKVWRDNILLMPVFLAPGSVLRVGMVKRQQKDGLEKTERILIGKFSRERQVDVLYIRRGIELIFCVQPDGARGRQTGTAAVMICTNLDWTSCASCLYA